MKAYIKIFQYLFLRKRKFFITFIFTIIKAILNVSMALVTYEILNIAQNGTIIDVISITIIIIIYLAFMGSVSYISTVFKHDIVQKTICKLRIDLIHSIMRQEYSSFSKNSYTDYNSLLTQDTSMIEESFYYGIEKITYYAVSFIIAIGSMIYLNFYVTLWVFIMTFIVLNLPTIYNKKFQEETKKMSFQNSRTYSSIKDILYSYSFTRNNSDRKYLIEKNESELEDNRDQKIFLSRIKSKVDIMSNTSAWATSFTTSSISAYFVIVGKLTIPSMLALSQLMNNISYPLVSISKHYHSIRSLKPIIEKINLYLERKEINRDKCMTFCDRIKCNHISYSYGTNFILKDLSIDFEYGKKYLIIGKSGCGKSTLLKLIAHYYDCKDGSIELDNQNIIQYTDSELDQIMTLMTQEVYLINDSLKNNITLMNPKYTEEEIQNAIHDCGLADLVNRLPKKENEIINEDGNNFSGGERQRIALARSIIRKSPILLLDEFSAALDEKNAKEIEKIITHLNNVMVLNISHKIYEENLQYYDEIIEIDNGGCKKLIPEELHNLYYFDCN